MVGPDVLIAVKNLTKVYGKGNLAVKALDVKNLEIRRGELVALTGPSGCSKTTLLNLLGALDSPTTGDILFEGKRFALKSEASLCSFRRKKIGFIFQSYHLIPTLSVLKNVLTPALPLGKGYRRHALELLELVGLAGKEDRRPGMLSGGEQQRVAIARALLLEPEVILADEPTGNLDSFTGAGIMDLLKKLNQRGKTVLVATHDQQVAKDCGRNIRMIDGRIN
ncbi:Lipoprotein-releasing system ATP-binding protein LolD [Pelotomaculum sp. FP]|uniref:ABC transporter ATP-binding protein n=1 Tax=Pelotomaculum sp. FP TaxID=261474 RepID=UPI0011028320|nr:ABC transporter ATP-binding protein [Pelotomaculum sp. FP]TEB14382.1 Lipoprotein-releasing system ATP-binding protein LolD [Pelotomaculum sp. FP]